MSSDSICLNIPPYRQDKTYHSLNIQDTLVVCKLINGRFEAQKGVIDNLVVGNLSAPNGDKLTDFAVITDDTQITYTDNNNMLTVSGLGGNETFKLAPHIIEITDKRNLSPYVVGLDALTAEYTDIQSAINAASAAGGGVVLITHGTYGGFTLNDSAVMVLGLVKEGTVVTTPCTIQDGTVKNLFFKAAVNVNGGTSTSVVNLEDCRFDGAPLGLNMNFTSSSAQLNIYKCESNNPNPDGVELSFNNGILNIRESTFHVVDTYFSVVCAKANGQVVDAFLENTSIYESGIQSDNDTNITSLNISNCRIRSIDVGITQTDYINFIMNGGRIDNITVSLVSPTSLTQRHLYTCVLSNVNIFSLPSNDASFVLYRGICTFNNCQFINEQKPLIKFINLGNNLNINKAQDIVMVRNCTFANYVDGATCTCIDLASSGGGRVFTKGNIVQPNTQLYGSSTIITIASGTATVINEQEF